MSLASEVAAIRGSAGLSRAAHVAVVRVQGAGALDLLQNACTQSPYVREGRVRHTLLLRDDASVFADAFVVMVDDGLLVVAEGPTEAELVAWLAALGARTPALQASARPTSDEWTVLGVDGPYAWELLAGLLGPPVLGMPYLTLLRRDDVLCLRAGKTGEYGYLLLVPRASADEIEEKLVALGAPLDLARVGLEALDVCALESWQFSLRNVRETSLASPLTPIELQLQWRVVATREFVGASAFRARRAAGARARVTCFTSASPVAPGALVRLGEHEIGEVLAARESPTLGVTVGVAMLELRFAHPHLDLAAGGALLRTQTASLVDNASLRVHPLKHAYATRNA